MRLYTYWRSSSAWRVRIALQHKRVDHELVPVHLIEGGGQQHSPAHRARNPMGQIPVLEVDGPDGPRALSQSMAILDWLEHAHPEPALYPSDPWRRAQAIAWAELVVSGIQPLQNLAVLQRLEAAGVDKGAWGRDRIAEGLAALEAAVQQTVGTFLVGDAVTVADVCLVPQLYNARRFGCDLSTVPTLCRVEAACEALPAFQAAHPDQQPDAP